MATAVAASRALPPPPAFPAAPAIHAGWALFDPFVVTEDVAAVASDGTTSAFCTTSGGRDVRVSLRLADPPAASYVEMRTDDAELHGEASVVAADGDLLLIDMAVTEPPSTTPREHNFLVYRAHPSSPSLRLLPHRDDWDAYAGITARRRRDGDEEEEEFVAAAFGTEITLVGDGDEGAEEVGRLTRFSSSTGQYEELDLPIPFDPSKGLYKLVWHTDKVFAFRGGLMCFVDYHRGILLCDVFATSPELRFIPFPEIEIWDDKHDYGNGRRLPQEHRTVGVSNGVMRFVDVSDGLFGRRRHPFAVTVTTWTLRTPAAAEMEEWEWEKDGVLQVGDLWESSEFRRSPLYPAVCKHDPGVVGFALMDPKFHATKDAWVIMVDVRDGVAGLRAVHEPGEGGGGPRGGVRGCCWVPVL
ncbi:unnamed protein product [Urochloa humidicola]